MLRTISLEPTYANTSTGLRRSGNEDADRMVECYTSALGGARVTQSLLLLLFQLRLRSSSH